MVLELRSLMILAPDYLITNQSEDIHELITHPSPSPSPCKTISLKVIVEFGVFKLAWAPCLVPAINAALSFIISLCQ